MENSTRLDVQTYRCATDVLSRIWEEEAVLLHATTGIYFSLNEVGTFVWRAIQDSSGLTLGEIQSEVEKNFRATNSGTSAEVTEFLRELVEAGLVSLEKMA